MTTELIVIGINGIKSTYPNNTFVDIKINSEKIKIFKISTFTNGEDLILEKNKIAEIRLVNKE